mgnify:CR=1 FL=1
MNLKDENVYNKQVFVDNLRYYLNAKGVSQKDVAEALGTSQGTISDWLKMRTFPRMDRLQALAEFFGVEMSDLVENKNILDKDSIFSKIKRIETRIVDSPESVELHLAIEQLSPENRATIKALVEHLLKGEN